MTSLPEIRCAHLKALETWTDSSLPMKKSTNGQGCFSYGGAKQCNSLSVESKQATSVYGFKENVRKLHISFLLIVNLIFVR